MSPRSSPSYGSAVNEPTRRAYFELLRNKVDKVNAIIPGLTVLGNVSLGELGSTSDEIRLQGLRTNVEGTANNVLQLLQHDTNHRPYLAIFGGTDGERKMYVGYADTTTDEVSVNADDGNLQLRAPNGSIRLFTGTGEVKDIPGRQFVRTDTSRGSPQLIQWGRLNGLTNANGDLSYTFDEPFTSIPSVQCTFIGSSPRFAHVTTRNTTGFTVRLRNDDGSAAANLTQNIDWIAMSAKTDV